MRRDKNRLRKGDYIFSTALNSVEGGKTHLQLEERHGESGEDGI